LFESLAIAKVLFLIEVAVECYANKSTFSKYCNGSKSHHRSFSTLE